MLTNADPFIFRGHKSITTRDPQQATLLRLASNNIAIYCPHTALDAAPGGINAWLADILTADGRGAERKVANPIANPPAGFEGAGYGMEVRFAQPQPITTLLKAVGERIADGGRVLVAAPDGVALDASLAVRSAAVCAGSGFDVLARSEAELIVTGEMTHHNALRCAQLGKVVFCVLHSNTERLFLKERLQPLLEQELRASVADARVLVSEEDRDPFRIVDVSSL